VLLQVNSDRSSFVAAGAGRDYRPYLVAASRNNKVAQITKRSV